LDRRVKRGEKGIQIFAPLIGYKRAQATAEPEEKGKKAKKNAPAEAKTEAVERQLIGFRAVYVFDRLSRDLRPSLCALDGFRLCHSRSASR
jgi:hypothetical protein